MQKLRYPLLITALVLVLMLAYAVLSTPAPPVPLAVTPLVQQDIANALHLTGTVTLREQSRVSVAGLAQVNAVHVAVGQTVAQGDALFTCVPTQVLPTLTFDDLAPLLTGDFSATGQPVGTVYADRDGVVLQLPQIGDTLYPALSAACVGDPTQYAITLQVPELYADAVQVGQTADFVRTDTATFHATVTQVAPQAVQAFSLTGNASAVVNCTLTPDSTPATPLKAGTSVQVKLYTDTVSSAFTVPYSAIFQANGQEYIAVWRTGALTTCAVQSGYQMVDCVQVTPMDRTLQAGDWIVTDGAQLQAGIAYEVQLDA